MAVHYATVLIARRIAPLIPGRQTLRYSLAGRADVPIRPHQYTPLYARAFGSDQGLRIERRLTR